MGRSRHPFARFGLLTIVCDVHVVLQVEVSGNRATDVVKHPLSFGPGKPQRLRVSHSLSSRSLMHNAI